MAIPSGPDRAPHAAGATKKGRHGVLAEIREEGEKVRQKEAKAKDDTLAVLSLEQKEQWEKMQQEV